MWGEGPGKSLGLKMFRQDFVLRIQNRKNRLDLDVARTNGSREKSLSKMT